MKRYEKYKPSGVEWIGEIPEHWSLKRLKYEVHYEKGKNPKELTFDERGKVYLTMDYLRGNPKQTFYVEDFEKYVNVEENQILLLWDGSNAGEFIRSKAGILSSTMAALNLHNNNLGYTWYFLKTFERKLKETTIGMGIPHVNSEDFKNHIFIIPFREEQIAIAAYLDEKTAQIDTLIEKKQKLIELLKEERTAIINQAVTKGLNHDSKGLRDEHDYTKKKSRKSNNQVNQGSDWLGDPSTSLRACIPEHWEVKKLKYVAEINSTSLTEKENDDLEIEYIDISSVNEYGEIMQTASYFYSDAPSRARRIIHKGDTIISTVRTYLKAIAFIDVENNNLICSTGFAVIRPSEKLEPNFLFYLSRSEKMVDRIMAMSKGVSYPAIDSEDIKNLVGWFPDNEEQRIIVHHIEAHTTRIDTTISKIEKEIELLQEYRTALISEVVTGKIKVI